MSEVRRDSEQIIGRFFDFLGNKLDFFGFDGFRLVNLLFRLGGFLSNLRVKVMKLVYFVVGLFLSCVFLVFMQKTVIVGSSM